MAKNKKSKSLLNEATVRRMMRLADIPELSESFFAEDYGTGDAKGRTTKKGQKDEPGEDGYKKDAYGTPGKGEEDKPEKGPKAKSPGYRPKADGQESSTNENLFAEDEHEEEEIDAMGDELGAEDDIADEEGAELDAEASGGDAEITPEAAQAIVDLAAQLEASGALEGGEEVVDAEAEVEMSDVGGEEEVEIEGEEEIEELEEALAKLGIEVIDDKKLNEAVRKRVIARLRKEKRARLQEAKINKIADRIFARLQKK